MKNMKDYHSLYSLWDVLLLRNVIENFRNNSFKSYGLCLSHYLSAPGLSGMQSLKWKKLNLKFLQMLTFTHSLKKVLEAEFLIFLIDIANTAQQIKFSIKDFSSKCDQIHKKLWI